MRISDWSSDVCSSDLNAGMESREVLELLRRQPSRRGEQPSLLIHPIVWLGTLIARSGVQITLRGTLTTMLVIAVIAFLALQGALAVGRLPTILAPLDRKSTRLNSSH